MYNNSSNSSCNICTVVTMFADLRCFSDFFLDQIAQTLLADKDKSSKELAHTIELAARSHLEEGLRNNWGGEYCSEHWLGTFAMLALTNRHVK